MGFPFLIHLMSHHPVIGESGIIFSLFSNFLVKFLQAFRIAKEDAMFCRLSSGALIFADVQIKGCIDYMDQV